MSACFSPDPHEGHLLAGDPAGDVPKCLRRSFLRELEQRPAASRRQGHLGVLRHQPQQGQTSGIHGVVDGGSHAPQEPPPNPVDHQVDGFHVAELGDHPLGGKCEGFRL